MITICAATVGLIAAYILVVVNIFNPDLLRGLLPALGPDGRIRGDIRDGGYKGGYKGHSSLLNFMNYQQLKPDAIPNRFAGLSRRTRRCILPSACWRVWLRGWEFFHDLVHRPLD